MTLYERILYLTLYKPRSEDATETAVLVPAAGAPHADEFKVASASGVAGFQPYLDAPSHRAAEGNLNPLTRRLEVGEHTVELLSPKVGGVQAQAWVEAFLGNANGINRLSGVRALLEESTDGGDTTSTLATLRVADIERVGRKRMRVSLRNAVNQLRADVFISTPHHSITYAFRDSLLPFGLPAAYGPYAAVAILSATLHSN